MSYAAIDRAIEDWASSNHLHLFKSFAGREARFCYVSKGRETSQISVDHIDDAHFVVHVWSVETLDDREFHKHWDADPTTMKEILDKALEYARRLLSDGRE